MGYRGKLVERERARELRAQAWTLQEIADELGVGKGSVSVWVRDVDFVPRPRNRGHPAGAKHPMRLRKEAEIEQCRVEADGWAEQLTPRELAAFCLGLYAGEGAKGDGRVSIANTNAGYLRVFMAWLRDEFDLDESRWRARLYLHQGLDLVEAEVFWAGVLAIPRTQFTRPYRAVVDSALRSRKHSNGCVTVSYADARLHRRVMARIEAIVSPFDNPG